MDIEWKTGQPPRCETYIVTVETVEKELYVRGALFTGYYWIIPSDDKVVAWSELPAPHEPITKPSINWEHVAPKFKWLAKDVDGECYLYEDEPVWRQGGFISGTCWTNARRTLTSADGFESLGTGTCPPEDSLVRRPE